MFKEIKTKVTNFAVKHPAIVSVSAAASIAMTDMANAGTAQSVILKALNYVITIIFYLGIFFAIISFAQLMLALKREDAEAQSTQIRNLLIGIVLTSIAGIVNGLGILDSAGMGGVSVQTDI